ncbi:MAG: hypothetical protein H0T46_10145 [Deltaproteobacteria bacterium]|nr:hypothetical protein [Deltaproteobacteria bacterium]
MRFAFAIVASLTVAACHSPTPVTPPGLRLGTLHRPIRTTSPEAQARFDRGLVAMYGFNYDEARYQFHTALRADESCAMCAWGYAMSGSTNINDVDKQWPGTRVAAERAVKLSTTDVERALAEALVKRLAPASAEMGMPAPQPERDKLSVAYADAMRSVAARFPADDDVQIALAEALLIATPRFVPWWEDGQPASPSVEEARGAIEGVLARSPQSIGAIHYYIHITDQSPHVAKAAPYADKLGALAPDAGHLVHMPSHTYLSLGRYAEAEDVNIAAIAADKRYLDRTPPGSQYEMFTMHPKDYLWYVVFWAGKRTDAVAQAAELAKDPMRAMPNPLGFGPSLFMALISARYGMWDEALKLPESDGAITNISTRFARGLAFVGKRRLFDAAAEVDAIRKAVAAANFSTPAPTASPPPHGGTHGAPGGHGPPPDAAAAGGPPMPPAMLERIRETIVADGESAAAQLEAAIAFAKNDKEKAIERCQAAVEAEDDLPNEGELTSFPLPARQRLGAYLLAAGRAKDAEKAYREDLVKFPENGWSLFGLATALDAQKSPEAAAVWARFKKTWARADVKLTSSVF